MGSDSHLVNSVVQELMRELDLNVIGMSFSEACKDRARIARLAPECLVITHSVGMMLLKNMSPKEVIAIAPPMPQMPSLFTLRLAPKMIAFIRSGSESHDRRKKILNYYLHSFKEHVMQPYWNSIGLREARSFNAARLSVEMMNCGSKVILGFMENDRLFPDSSQHPHIKVAKSHGVNVCDNIIGHHDEFILYPIDVLAQLHQIEI